MASCCLICFEKWVYAINATLLQAETLKYCPGTVEPYVWETHFGRWVAQDKQPCKRWSKRFAVLAWVWDLPLCALICLMCFRLGSQGRNRLSGVSVQRSALRSLKEYSSKGSIEWILVIITVILFHLNMHKHKRKCNSYSYYIHKPN